MTDALDVERQRMMASMPVVSEEEVIDSTLKDFVNGDQWPQFMLRLNGIPDMAKSAALEGRPVQLKIKGHEKWEKLQSDFRAQLIAVASDTLDRASKKRIRENADRVTIRIKGGQRGMRPRDLEIPDLESALAYILHLFLTRAYGRQLAKCKLDGCPNLFLREPRRGQPERYCSSSHAKKANELAAGQRAKDYRARQEAVARLSKRYPTRARDLVTAVKDKGLSADELLLRAEAEAATRKPSKHK